MTLRLKIASLHMCVSVSIPRAWQCPGNCSTGQLLTTGRLVQELDICTVEATGSNNTVLLVVISITYLALSFLMRSSQLPSPQNGAMIRCFLSSLLQKSSKVCTTDRCSSRSFVALQEYTLEIKYKATTKKNNNPKIYIT